jgi:hypothetical protein
VVDFGGEEVCSGFAFADQGVVDLPGVRWHLTWAWRLGVRVRWCMCIAWVWWFAFSW